MQPDKWMGIWSAMIVRIPYGRSYVITILEFFPVGNVCICNMFCLAS